METCLCSLGTTENMEALPPLKLENIFVLCPSPPVRILKSNAKCMCQKRSCNSRNQFYYPTPMPIYKTLYKERRIGTCPCCSCFFHHLTFQKTLSRFFCSYMSKREKKINQEHILSGFCLSRFSSKSYSPLDLLLIYCKTIVCYARVVCSCRTKALQHKSLQVKLYSFGECRGYS